MRVRSAVRLLVLGLLAPVALLASADAQTLLLTLDTPNPQANAYFGSSVAVGDVNGDGKGDIAVGATYADVGGTSDVGRVYVFSGADRSLLFTLDTPNPQHMANFGRSLAVADVNGDGRGDITVGAPLARGVSGNQYQGRAYVFSGTDGSLLFTLDTPNPQVDAVFGESVAVGEMNGDGKGDIAVGAGSQDVGGNVGQGRVYVFSGADGSLLFTLDTPNPHVYASFGWSVAVADVNGDGRADIGIGVPNEDVGGTQDAGRSYVFSGANGSLLFTLDTPNPQAETYFGESLAVGDVNGDGKGDIAVGSYHETVGSNAKQGRVYVFSGANGSPLFTLDTPNPLPFPEFGCSLAVGDVNGDGKGDITVGAHYETVNGNTIQGRVYVFSGANGSLLLSLDTPNPQAVAFGESVAVGDANGDGRGDIAVGVPFEDVGGNAGQGRVYVFSGPAEPTPTPRPGVGGTVKLPPAAVAAESGAPTGGSGWTVGAYAVLAAGTALAVGGWYARRRWLR